VIPSEPLRIPITNHVTGLPYFVVPANELEAMPNGLALVSRICNEPEVYDWLFRESYEGRPHTEKNASAWFSWSREGWLNSTRFVFATVDAQGDLAAACDIKTNDRVAEIGYWASARHRGVMTNTVKAIVDFARFRSFEGLFARTRLGNVRSEAVLLRSGFTRAAEPEGLYWRFDHRIQP
jgi:RimJ/RimL family protein N-acetyltransferase